MDFVKRNEKVPISFAPRTDLKISGVPSVSLNKSSQNKYSMNIEEGSGRGEDLFTCLICNAAYSDADIMDIYVYDQARLARLKKAVYFKND